MIKLIHKFSHLFLVGTLVFSQGLRAETTETTYYIPDAQGSPIAAMDEAGNIKWRKHYQPFGKEIEQDEASRDNRIGYTGHVHDRASGLTYMGARYYDPEIGRFLSMDPAAVNPNDPRTFNRYAYANNSPYNYMDPDGESAVVLEGIAIGLLYLAFAPGHEQRVDTLKQIWAVYNENAGDDGDSASVGAQNVTDLTGKSREEAVDELEESGFEHQGETEGGYDKWYHPDGSRIQIRPNGEVVRTGPKTTPEEGGKKYRPRYDQNGNKTDSHNTGEKLSD